MLKSLGSVPVDKAEAAGAKASEPLLVVAGPTCSGKSALAMRLAQAFGGCVINADAMQLYRGLRVLTARPDALEAAAVPHRLYGILPPWRKGTVAGWCALAVGEISAARSQEQLPVLCGGTGMYLNALAHGLADVPSPTAEARAEARTLCKQLGSGGLHAKLSLADPETALRLRPQDPQRVIRAWEVWRSTGHGLAWWWREAESRAFRARYIFILLDPPRDALRAAIRKRFGAMVRHGALEEVRALENELAAAGRLEDELPLLRAHGVPELRAVLAGAMTLEEAADAATRATVRYTKRQATWFRHHPLGAVSDRLVLQARFENPHAPSAEMEGVWRQVADFLQARLGMRFESGLKR
ncbi:tRNA (adenosine(37)-N6)-dimethylallyltransferase MiaA [Formicincola oecophyllae]|uniref:tRNA dimethylallyltransferase n=1 Tax=Formicincola oecophyllae TaxID=2558361 RepID=A0A4Y6U808_9PROT|nr:tRNA (adenosine(37)-N6)-dimethylallyltransferase MiaA [Formicincola oecophyllae]QDH13563.1 tRNA (adenosine(37)-N6)-dimethylallyltransferase MiaA [Formicincola oecophyllae]